MKKNFGLCSLLLIAVSAHAQLWLVDPLEAIYPDKNNTASHTNYWQTDISRNTQASVHLLFGPEVDKIQSIKVINKGREISSTVIRKLIDVPVEQNTGVDSRTEQYKGKENPYVLRQAPFRIFEVIGSSADIPSEQQANYSAYRLTIPSNVNKKAGKYQYHIEVQTANKELRATFTVQVHSVNQPKAKNSDFFYTNWFNLSKMEEAHQVKRWTDEWYVMLNKYAAIMAHGRQNSITIPGELFQFKNNTFTLDEEKLLRYITIFRQHGFQYFEAPHLMNRGENDDWGDPELKVVLTKNRYYKENGKRDIQQIMTTIRDFAVKHELTESWLQHISDEPTPVQAVCYQDIAKQVKEIFPQVKIMEATNAREELAGAVDIWCPLINKFQEHESFFRDREQKGEKVLVYTCLIPGGKWLNRTLDMERLRQVYFGWGASGYETGGYLHWGLNQYQADPFTQSVVKHPSPAAGPTNFLPAGDTHIIYPGENGPLSSIRFEAHRLGIEDYDLLQLLKMKDEKQYNALMDKLFRSYTDYNVEVKQYRTVKKQLLLALSQ